MRERRAARGRATPRSLSGPRASEPGPGHRVCPSALPAPARSGMPEENLAAESGSLRDRCATRSSGPGKGAAPPAPARPGRKRRMRDVELPSSPARGSEESAPPPRSPRQDRCPGGGGRAARPRNLRRVTLGGCRFPYGGGRRACV